MKKQIILLISLFTIIGCSSNMSDFNSPSNVDVSSISSINIDSKIEKDFSSTKEIYLTTGGKEKLLEKQSNIKEINETNSKTIININNKRLAKVDSFGAALTHASAHQILLYKNKDERKKVLEDLFTIKGANFNTIRVPIGASDFHAESHLFTCCDEIGSSDNLLKNFTLGHDTEIIQVIKEIYEINQNLKIIAVPWSAPSWMKVNSHSSTEDPTGPALCGGKLKDEYLNTFCDYLTEFCNRYEDLEIKINYLSFMNEPTFNLADYPCMELTARQATLMALRLNSTLPECTKLMAYDHNCEDKMYTYLSEEFEKKQIYDLFSSIAIHGYGSESIPTGTKKLRALYPEKSVYMTEITEWEHGSSFADDLMYVCKNTTIRALANGLNGTLYWNLALDKQGKPNIGQKSICYGVVNIEQDSENQMEYTKNASYYGLAHISKILNFTQGIDTYSLETIVGDSGLLACGFNSGDNYSISIANPTNNDMSFDINLFGHIYSLSLCSKGLISLII